MNDDTPYEDRTVAQLQDELAARGLPTSGLKAELVDRLREDDQLHAQAEADQQAAQPDGDDQGERVSTCVVNGGRGTHVGNAVNGLVCSYHAVSHKADGTLR